MSNAQVLGGLALIIGMFWFVEERKTSQPDKREDQTTVVTAPVGIGAKAIEQRRKDCIARDLKLADMADAKKINTDAEYHAEVKKLTPKIDVRADGPIGAQENQLFDSMKGKWSHAKLSKFLRQRAASYKR